MIFFDFETFKYDWMMCYLDTDSRTMHTIINDRDLLQRVYDKYKNTIWVGYNSRGYDQWVLKGILAGFDPYKINDWIINKGRKGHEYSRLLSKFPLINYDTAVGFRSLKECEAFMGHDIRETTVPFDIDRPLTKKELEEVEFYCKHDVMETFEVFVEMKSEFESHLGLVKEFGLNPMTINKTKAQISAEILGASKRERDDEFDIGFPDTLKLDKYKHIVTHYKWWSEQSKNYDDIGYECKIADVSHVFGVGGLHGAIENFYGDGWFVIADVASYYPAMMIEYDLLSRNVSDRNAYRKIRDERIRLKGLKDPREYPRKIVLNSTFGAQKDQYNPLYDPLKANEICIYGQLLLVDLIEKLEPHVKLIQSNTDGIIFQINSQSEYDTAIVICNEWSKRTRMDLEFENAKRIIQKDVNNYILVMDNGKVKSKGAFVKKLSKLDNHLPIVNKAVTEYLVNGTPVEQTILSSDDLIDFQFITKVTNKYDYAVYNDQIMHNKVYRVFASLRDEDGTLYKKHKSKDKPDKTAGTPDKCFINNENIVGKKCPSYLDKNWYVNLAKERIAKFLGE